MKSLDSEKGRTIPTALRDRLGRKPGQVSKLEVMRAVDRVFGLLGPLNVDSELGKSRGKAWNRAQDGPRANRR